MKLLRVIAVVALCSVAIARADTFKIDSAKSTIAFKVRHMLVSAKGKFAKFTGSIEVDRAHPERSTVNVSIDAASIDTGIAKRDEHLRGELFDVAQFPKITFKSRQVKQKGAQSGEISGDLTMHGVTRPITLSVQLVSDLASLENDGATRWRVTTAPLKRSQFGLVFSKSAETVSMISDDVAIELEIQGDRAK